MKITNQIIKDYKHLRLKYADPWLIDCKKERSIDNVILMASTARNNENKKHPHQNLIPIKILYNFYRKIMKMKETIKDSDDFHSLYKNIEKCKIKGIGDLAIYDTAQRIGVSIGKYPEYIYIHRGTKVGAEKFLKKKIKEKVLDKSIFKGLSSLSCSEIEDILCIYKDDIYGGKCVGVDEIKRTCL